MTRRVRPHHLILGFWLLLAFAFGLSGVVSTITQQHDDSPITREVFGNIPGAWKAFVYVLSVATLTYVGVQFMHRFKNWERGVPDRRRTTLKNAKRRAGDFRAGVYMQTLLRDPAAGIMHSLIYFSFLILFAVTTILEINHQLPGDLKFLHGDVYLAWSFVADATGVALLVGTVWAIVRRYVQRPYRIRIKSKPEHALILGTILAIGLTGFGAEAFRIALNGRPEHEQWSVVGWPLSGLVDGLSESALTRSGGSPTSSASSSSWRSSPSPCCGTSSRRP